MQDIERIGASDSVLTYKIIKQRLEDVCIPRARQINPSSPASRKIKNLPDYALKKLGVNLKNAWTCSGLEEPLAIKYWSTIRRLSNRGYFVTRVSERIGIDFKQLIIHHVRFSYVYDLNEAIKLCLLDYLTNIDNSDYILGNND